jgi:hypothetical protein
MSEFVAERIRSRRRIGRFVREAAARTKKLPEIKFS